MMAWTFVQLGGHKPIGSRPSGWALVDAADAPSLLESRWSHDRRNNYAFRNLPSRDATMQMHRQIAGLVPGDPRQVDHINRDRLDNRRANLRIVGGARDERQRQNVSSNRGSSSRFRGVSWDKRDKRWVAIVCKGGAVVYRRYCRDEVEAARLAESARKIHLPHAEPDPALAEVA